ncbi:MAG: DUF2769 domain-containing protein [Methanospirillum sp.]
MDAPATASHSEGTDRDRLRQACICPQCPTYTPCAGDAQERLYCVLGRSPRCITEDLGCVCPACPVTEELGLEHLTFCLEGAEAEQQSGTTVR